jgi:hypothetical protein
MHGSGPKIIWTANSSIGWCSLARFCLKFVIFFVSMPFFSRNYYSPRGNAQPIFGILSIYRWQTSVTEWDANRSAFALLSGSPLQLLLSNNCRFGICSSRGSGDISIHLASGAGEAIRTSLPSLPLSSRVAFSRLLSCRFVTTGSLEAPLISELLVATANLIHPSEHRSSTVRISTVRILKAEHNIGTFTSFQQKEFNDGSLFCLTSIVTFPVPPFIKSRKISLGCNVLFQFWNMNGKRHEIAITELGRVRTSAIWQV